MIEAGAAESVTTRGHEENYCAQTLLAFRRSQELKELNGFVWHLQACRVSGLRFQVSANVESTGWKEFFQAFKSREVETSRRRSGSPLCHASPVVDPGNLKLSVIFSSLNCTYNVPERLVPNDASACRPNFTFQSCVEIQSTWKCRSPFK